MSKQTTKALRLLKSRLDYLHTLKNTNLVEADNYYLVKEIEETLQQMDYLEPYRYEETL
jgi:hypothetical protein